MSESNDRELEIRLAAIEQELTRAHALIERLQDRRRYQPSAAAVVLGAMAVGLTIGAARPGAFQARAAQVVRAPFTVVDASDRPIMTVDDLATRRGITVYRDGARVSAQMFANSNGSGAVIVRSGKDDFSPGAGVEFDDGLNPFFGARGTDGKFFVQLRREGTTLPGPAVVNDSSGKAIAKIQAETVIAAAPGQQAVTEPRGFFLLNAAGSIASQLSIDAIGNGRVKVSGSKGTSGPEAALIITTNGSLLAMSNLAGKVTADVSSWDGHGVYTGGQKVAQLGISGTMGGQMWLADPAGTVMVDADYNGSVGRVRTGPNAKLSGSLIGSRIP